jgi:hypothetical protein
MQAIVLALNFLGTYYLDNSFSFDILIDKKFKPYLLEVNHAPSFNDDTEVDKHVKTELITDTLRLLNITYANKMKALEAQRKALELNNQIKKPNKDDSETIN